MAPESWAGLLCPHTTQPQAKARSGGHLGGGGQGPRERRPRTRWVLSAACPGWPRPLWTGHFAEQGPWPAPSGMGVNMVAS